MNKRLLYVSCCIIACITILSQCINKAENNEAAFRGPQYAGAAACAGCHKSIFDTYMGTAHYHTSRPANTSTIKGSFAAPDHIFTYDSATKVVMEARDSGLFQTAYNNDMPQESHRFDIVVGSGRKARRLEGLERPPDTQIAAQLPEQRPEPSRRRSRLPERSERFLRLRILDELHDAKEAKRAMDADA